jgi:hypothetical protein
VALKQVFAGHSGTETGFSPNTSIVPVNIIPPMLRIHLYLHASFTTMANGRSLGTFQKATLFRK